MSTDMNVDNKFIPGLSLNVAIFGEIQPQSLK